MPTCSKKTSKREITKLNASRFYLSQDRAAYCDLRITYESRYASKRHYIVYKSDKPLISDQLLPPVFLIHHTHLKGAMNKTTVVRQVINDKNEHWMFVVTEVAVRSYNLCRAISQLQQYDLENFYTNNFIKTHEKQRFKMAYNIFNGFNCHIEDMLGVSGGNNSSNYMTSGSLDE
jgi:hypothetical protein